MGLNLRWIVNASLLAFPIAVTLGVLMGIQTGRKAAGKPPLWVDNGITKSQYCQKSYGITPASIGLEYTCESGPFYRPYEAAMRLTKTRPSEPESVGMESR